MPSALASQTANASCSARDRQRAAQDDEDPACDASASGIADNDVGLQQCQRKMGAATAAPTLSEPHAAKVISGSVD